MAKGRKTDVNHSARALHLCLGSGEGEALSLDASKDVIHGLGMDRNKNMLSG